MWPPGNIIGAQRANEAGERSGDYHIYSHHLPVTACYILRQVFGCWRLSVRLSSRSLDVNIPVKSPVFNRSLLFFWTSFYLPPVFLLFFLLSPVFSPVFLENQSKTTIISCFSSSSAQIYLNSYSLACKLSSSSLPKQYSVDLIEPSLPKSCN